MRRAAAIALAAAVVAGCGTNPREPGDPQAEQVLDFAAHGRALADRAGGVARAYVQRTADARDTRLALSELMAQSRLAAEGVESTVPSGVPGREPALEGLHELVKAASFLHSFASGHGGGMALARAHLAAAVRALGGVAGAVGPHVGATHDETLAHLRAPAPRLP